jgi:phosphoribosyl 1,2-cyclic phosphodiesterase
MRPAFPRMPEIPPLTRIERLLDPSLDKSLQLASAKRDDSATTSNITVRCWGTRGSIPSPGPQTVVHGGNTTCLEVCGSDLRIIFDAGTGIRPLGMDLVERGPNAIHIFLTHFHWDHIQGFPFFAPLYDAEDRIKVIGPKQKDIDVQNLFAGQMGPIYFPVPFSFVAAEMEFEHLNDGGYEVGEFELEVMRMRHPSFVIGYKIKVGGHVICFVPDNELDGDMYNELDRGFEKRMVDFVGDADLLIHDSMYTEAEYPKRVGWGHSTFEQTLRLGAEAGVKKLLFSHHDPSRTDYELDAVVAKMREDAARSGADMVVEAAKEGVDSRMDGSS